MSGSGSAWIKPKKRGGLRPDALTGLAHPRIVRTGQRYFPLLRTARSRAVICVVRVHAEACVGRCEDADKREVRVRLDRLLALATDGRGRHFRFIGYRSGRTYTTHAMVLDVDRHWTRIICPDWHPELTITVASGSLPPDLRHRGAWLTCRGDLGASNPARVGLSGFGPAEPDLSPNISVPVIPTKGAATQPSKRMPAGPRVVLFPGRFTARGRVYLTGHPPPVRPGDRPLVCGAAQAAASATVRAVRRLPNGVEIEFHDDWEPAHGILVPAEPMSGVADGCHGRQRWLTLEDAE